jgi:hypothetical protein
VQSFQVSDWVQGTGEIPEKYALVESNDLDKDKAGLTFQSGWHSPQDHEVYMEAFHMLSVIASCGRLPLKLFQVGRLDGKGGYEVETFPHILKAISPIPSRS